MSLAVIKGVEIFAAGTFHRGTPEEVTFTEADLDAMVTNWRTLSGGERPTYEPFVKLGKLDPHKGEPVTFEEGNPAAAVVRNVRREGKRILADFADVQPDPAKWIELKVYRKVSAEIDKPPEGEKHPEFGCAGPVLKAVALLGANPPAVKGLKDIPSPKFSSKKTKITHICFAEVSMSPERQEMLDYLASMGIDPAILEALDDAALSAIASAFKALAPAEEEMSEEDPVLAGAGVVGSGGTAVAAKPPQLLPKSLTAKFSETAKAAKGLESVVSSLSAKAKATAALIDANHTQAKRQLVHTFCEQAVKDGKLTPADVECDADGKPLPQTVKARLLRADHTRTHTFSEAGKTVARTELEMQMAEIASRKAHTFSEKVVVGTKPDLFNKIRADVAAEVAAKTARQGGKSVREKLHMLPPRGSR